jgi:peptidoglycan-N-acetylglucosamine deacetylase
MVKNIASLSLDLDNKWSYMKTHGDSGWESFPSYLDILIPRVLQFLKERNLTITFFIVGQDAALEKNHPYLKMIAAAGHEIGNHSFNHEPWLHLYSEAQIEEELARAEKAIEAVTGQRPLGFRGPGFSLSKSVLKILKRRGYQYDCSTFPTYLGPLARAYYFMTTRLSEQEKDRRKKLFGTLDEGLRPNKSYRWQMDGEGLVEIPVTTMPIFKIPFHMSYILYLSVFSKTLALAYFRIALLLCRLTGTQPSILLHPLDFLGNDDTQDLSFFPAMNLPSERKLEVLSKALGMLSASYSIVPMKEHSRQLSPVSDLPLVKPVFRSGGV